MIYMKVLIREILEFDVGARFTAADGNFTRELLVFVSKILFGAFRELHDFLRPAPEKQAILR